MADMTPPDEFPPMMQGQLDVEPRSTKWPTVIGVIAIVLASLGLLCGCGGYFTPQFQKWALDVQQQSGRTDPAMEAQVEVWNQFYLFFVVLLTIGLLLAIWELIAGIWLLRRRRSARAMFLGYGFASVALAALNLALQIIMTQAIVARLTEQGETAAITGVWVGASFGLVIGALFGLGWPALILIWFSRAKIKSEVAQWA